MVRWPQGQAVRDQVVASWCANREDVGRIQQIELHAGNGASMTISIEDGVTEFCITHQSFNGFNHLSPFWGLLLNLGEWYLLRGRSALQQALNMGAFGVEAVSVSDVVQKLVRPKPNGDLLVGFAAEGDAGPKCLR